MSSGLVARHSCSPTQAPTYETIGGRTLLYFTVLSVYRPLAVLESNTVHVCLTCIELIVTSTKPQM